MATFSTWRRMREVLGFGSNGKRKSKKERHLGLESLEKREMLSVSPGPQYEEDGTIFFWVTEHNSPLDHAMAFTAGQHELHLSTGTSGVKQGSLPVRAGETLWYTDIGVDILGGDKISGQFRVEDGNDFTYDDFVVTYVFISDTTGVWDDGASQLGQTSDLPMEFTAAPTDPAGHLVYQEDHDYAFFRMEEKLQPLVVNGVTSYPQTITATLKIGSVTRTVYYTAANFDPNELFVIAMEANTTTLATGRYDWTIDLVSKYANGTTSTQQFTGVKDVVTYGNTTPYGRGWSVDGLSSLNVTRLNATAHRGVNWECADGRMVWFHYDGTSFTAESGQSAHTQLYLNTDGTYTLHDRGERFNFNAAGQLILHQTLVSSTRWTYLSNGRVNTKTDENGRTATYTYLSAGTGRLQSITDYAGRVTTYAYDTYGRMTTVTEHDPDGGGALTSPKTTYAYSGTTNFVTKKTAPSGVVTDYAYSASYTNTNYALASITVGGVVQFTQTPLRKQAVVNTSVTGSSTSKLAPLPSLAGSMGTVTDVHGNSTNYRLDRYDNIVWQRTQEGSEFYSSFDTLGNQIAFFEILQHAEGDVEYRLTQYEYDSRGNRTKAIYPDGATETWTYDPIFDQPIAHTDQLGVRTLYTLAPTTGLVTEIRRQSPGSSASELIQRFIYDGNRRLVEEVDALGRTKSYSYDASGNLVRKVLPGNAVYIYTYDAAGQVLTETDPNGTISYYVYNEAGKLTSTTTKNPTVADVWDIPSTAPLGRWLESDTAFYTSNTVNLGNPSELNIDGKITLSAWIKSENTTGYRSILMHGLASGNEVYLRVNAGYYEVGSYIGGIVYSTKINMPSEDVGQWVHLVGTYDGTRWNLYRNGELVSSTAKTKGSIAINGNWHIGSQNGTKSFFYGEIREAGIWSGAMLANDVAAFYRGFSTVQTRTHTTYNNVGWLLSETDVRGATTTYTYDAYGRILTKTDALKQTTKYTYDVSGRLVEEVDPRSMITEYSYDSHGNLIQEYQYSIAPLGNWLEEPTAFRNSNTVNIGNPSELNFDGNITLSAWIKSENTTGLRTILMHGTASGNYVFLRVNAGYYEVGSYISAVTYSTKIKMPAEDTGQWVHLTGTYDGTNWNLYRNGELISSTAKTKGSIAVSANWHIGSRNGTTNYFYGEIRDVSIFNDALTPEQAVRLYKDRKTLPTTIGYTYNAAGQRISATNAAGHVVYYEYDAMGRMTKYTTMRASVFYQMAYDAAGRKISETDPLGNTTTFTYDADGNLLTTTDPEGRVTTNVYDAVGQLLSVTDSKGNTTSYTYDLRGNLASETDALGQTQSFVYDLCDRTIEKTDRNGRVTRYSYDFRGHLISEKWIGENNQVLETIVYEHDANGNLLSVSDANTSYINTYDALSQLVSQTFQLDGRTIRFEYSYNTIGLRTTSALFVDGIADRVLTYTYDGLGRIQTLTETGQSGNNTIADKLLEYAYAIGTDGLLTTSIFRYENSISPDLIVETGYYQETRYPYSNVLHLVKNTSMIVFHLEYDLLNRTIHEQAYECSLPRYINRSQVDKNFTYDASGQLIAAEYNKTANPKGTVYLYNDNDPWYVTDANGRLLEDGVYRYTYDAEGNRTSRTHKTTQARERYEWDYRNRLTRVITEVYNGPTQVYAATQIIAYTYDAFNNLVQRRLDANGDGTFDAKSLFIPEDGKTVMQLDDDNLADTIPATITHRYLWSPDERKELLADTTSGGILWTLTDHNGSVYRVAKKTTDGIITVASMTYDTHGELFSCVDANGNATINPISFGYLGNYADPHTSLTYDAATSWYDTQRGGWISENERYVVKRNAVPVTVQQLITNNGSNIYCYTSGSVSFYLPANNYDLDNDPLTIIDFSSLSTRLNAKITLSPDGQFTYDPTQSSKWASMAIGAMDYDYFYYTVSDGRGGTSRGTVFFNLRKTNTPPVAVDDFFSTDNNTPIAISPLANDYDVDASQTITLQSFDAVSALGITLTLSEDGKIHYDPAFSAYWNSLPLGTIVTDSFTYTIVDTAGATSTATVYIDVKRVQTKPRAVDDYATTTHKSGAHIKISANDIWPDGTWLDTSWPKWSALGARVHFLDAPDAEYYGYEAIYNAEYLDIWKTTPVGTIIRDSFTYTIYDLDGNTSFATVYVDVERVNTPPVATTDLATTAHNTPFYIPVLANDYDRDINDSISIHTISSVSKLGVTLSVSADGQVYYDPTQVNWDYITDGKTVIQDHFTYSIIDSYGAVSYPVSVYIDVVNGNAPVATNDTATTNDITPIVIDILANDYATTPGGNVFLLSFDQRTRSGLPLTLTPDGKIYYDPEMYNSYGYSIWYGVPIGFVHYDTFSYTISDSYGNISTAKVNIAVTKIALPPVATDDNLVTDHRTSVRIAPLENDFSYHNEKIFTIDSHDVRTALGVLVVFNANGEYTYNPQQIANVDTIPIGTILHDRFTYTIKDSAGLTSTATVYIDVEIVSSPPVAVDDYISIAHNVLTSQFVPVLDNDWDSDPGDTIAIASCDAISLQGGTVRLLSGKIYYSPPQPFSRYDHLPPGTVIKDQFTYTITDSFGITSTATVYVDIVRVNTNPIACSPRIATSHAKAVTIDISEYAYDRDPGDFVTLVPEKITRSTLGVNLSINENGHIVYDPRQMTEWMNLPIGTVLTDRFSYTVVDSYGATATNTVIIQVTRENTVPVAVDDVAYTNNQTSITIYVTANDYDLDPGDYVLVQAELITYSQLGAMVKRGMNYDNFIYSPHTSNAWDNMLPGEIITDQFTYTIVDRYGATSTATVYVNVMRINTPPVAVKYRVVADNHFDSIVISPLENAYDVDPWDNISLTSFDSVSHYGVPLTTDGDGRVFYDPMLFPMLDDLQIGHNIYDWFYYTVTDTYGATSTNYIEIVAKRVNFPPVAVDDFFSTSHNQLLVISPLANDYDRDRNQTITFDGLDSYTARGIKINVDEDGRITYDPTSAADWATLPVGTVITDTFTYTITDGHGGTDTATVTITITRENTAPIATNDFAATTHTRPVTVNVRTNDYDDDLGDTFAVTAVFASQRGVTPTITADGQILYDPTDAADWATFAVGTVITDTFTYTITDSHGATATATVTIAITRENTAPIATDDTMATTHTRPITLDVLANDHDDDPDDTFTITAVGISACGVTPTITDDGHIFYDPAVAADWATLAVGTVITDTFTYTITDSHGATATATVTITITRENTAPVARIDNASTKHNVKIDISPLDNDSDPDPEDFIIFSRGDAQSSLGVPLTWTEDGSVHYDPARISFWDDLEVGTVIRDSFTYTITDSHGLTDTATVYVDVERANLPPVAVNDVVTTNHRTPAIIDVLANDHDPDGHAIHISSYDSGSLLGVQLQLNADGKIVYDPASATDWAAFAVGEEITDTFTYTITDSHGATDTATVTITIIRQNTAPTATDDAAATGHTQAVTVDVLTNDHDADRGDSIHVTSVTPSERGVTPTITADGKVIYDPTQLAIWAALAPNEVIVDTFRYTIIDNHGATSEAVVTVTITRENTPPAAVNDTAETTHTKPVAIDVTANDHDNDPGDIFTVTQVTPSLWGVRPVITANGRITYDPTQLTIWSTLAPGATITDTFTYTITDSYGATATASVTVIVTRENTAPVAGDDTVATTHRQPVKIDVTANDFDTDPDDAFTITAVGISEQGVTPTITADGKILYDPTDAADWATLAVGAVITDTFTYTITDSHGATATATVTITVTRENTTPVARDDEFMITTDKRVILDVLANDSDPDGDPLSLTGPTRWTSGLGAELVRLADNKISYDPTNALRNMLPGQTCQDTFTYTIIDQHGGTATATTTITLTKSLALAQDDLVMTNTTQWVMIEILANDFVPENSEIILPSKSDLGVSLIRTWDGKVFYDPTQVTVWQALAPGEIMLDVFTYTIIDAHGVTSTASVYINVQKADKPIINPPELPITDTWTYTISENGEMLLAFNTSLATHFDASIRSTLRFSLVEKSSHGTTTLYANGALLYRPDTGYSGTDTLIISVTHSDATIQYYALHLTISPVNHAPTAVNNTFTTNHKTAITINPLENDFDSDVGDSISLKTFDAKSRYGVTLTRDASGNILYDPTQVTVWQQLMVGDTLIDQFTYTITDDAGLTSTATVFITVTRANTPPTAINLTRSIDANAPIFINLFHAAIESDPGDYATLTGPATWLSANGATITRHADLTLQYDPSPIFSTLPSNTPLTDTFAYTLTDRHGATSTAIVTVTISKPLTSSTQKPVPCNDWATVGVGQTVVIPVLNNDFIPEGMNVGVQVASAYGGTAKVNQQGEIEYTAGNNHGSQLITYRLNYGTSFSETATIHVSVIGNSQSPIILNDLLETLEDTPITIPASVLLANDWSPAGMTLTIKSVSDGSNGTVTLLPNGDCLFTPKKDFNGNATFSYTAGYNNYSSSATVTVRVLPVNDPPAASDYRASTYVNQDVTIPLMNYVSDVDGDSLKIVRVDAANLRGRLTPVSGDGSNGAYRYSPNGAYDYLLPGESATETFTYTVSDPSGEEATATVTVVVSRQAAGISVTSAGSTILSNVTDTQLYDATFAVERTFTIYNNGSDVLQFDLSALRAMQLPASFEIIQYPSETLRPGMSTTLRFRFDGSANASINLPLGTNVPGMPTFTILHEETARASTGKTEISGFSISGIVGKNDNLSIGTLPIVTGTLHKDFDSTVGTAKIQFDLDNNISTIEAEVAVTNSGDVFSVNIGNYFSSGSSPLSFRYRVVTTINGQTREGSWNYYYFYLAPNPQEGQIRVENLKITSLDGNGEIRFDPYVVGCVNGDFQSQNIKIEFAHTPNAANVLETISISQSGGVFCYDPWAYEANFAIPKQIYYRLVVNNVAQTWQTYSLAYPNISTTPLNISLNSKIATKYGVNYVDYAVSASIEFYLGQYSSSIVDQYAAIRWDTDGDGIYDHIAEYLGGKQTFYPKSISHDELLNFRATPYFWSEEHQLWVPGATKTTGDFVVTSGYLNSIYQTDAVPDDSPLRYAITGSLASNSTVQKAFVRIAIDQNEDGIPDAYVYTDADGKFTYIPTDWALGNYGVVRAAVCTDDVGSTGTYAWTNTSYSCELKPTTLGMNTFKLADGNTLATPYFQGKLNATPSYEGYIVEFGHNNNTPVSRAVVNEDGTFTYLAVGAANSGNMYYRVGRWNPVANDYVYGSWNFSDYNFTPPTVKVAELKRANLTVNSDPTIQGKLTGTGNRNVSYKKVEIETNGVSVFVWTDAEGNFIYTPENLQANSYVSARARVLDWDYAAQQETPGTWFSMSSFTFVGTSTPSLSTLTLPFKTGTISGRTANPTIGGSVTNSDGYNNVIIEFYTKDAQNNSTILGYTTAASDGKYYWTPDLKANQATTIYAQAKNYDAYRATWLVSNEQNITITYDPTHDHLATFINLPSWIFSDINSPATTDTPYLHGKIENDGDKSLVSVEFRVAAPGSQNAISLGVAQADKDGNFSLYVSNLPQGDVTIEYRICEKTWNNAAPVRTGSWQAWNVHRAAIAPANPQIVPGSLEIVNNLETNRVLAGTDRPYVLGKVHLEGASTTDFASIQVEYRRQNYSEILGIADVESTGGFLLEISSPYSTSNNCYEFRPVYTDPLTGTTRLGSWTLFEFNWQASTTPLSNSNLLPVFGISRLDLYADTGVSNSDGITSNSTIRVDVSKPSSWGSLIVEWDTNGDGKADGSSSTYGGYTNIYPTVSSGPQTVYVRTTYGSGDNLQVSEWLPVSFVYYGGALSESQAIAQYSEWAEEAIRVSNEVQNTRIVSAATLHESIQAAQKKYFLESSALEKSYTSASLSAYQQYQNALTIIQTTHNNALQSAKNTLNTALATFNGDTTSFDFQEFAWNNITDNYSFAFPTNNPSAPDYPTTDYASPEVSLDPLYLQQLKTAQDAQTQAILSANRAYGSTKSDLTQTMNAAYDEAYRAYTEAMADAKATYEETLAREITSLYQRLQMAEEEARYQKEKQAILSRYTEEIAKNPYRNTPEEWIQNAHAQYNNHTENAENDYTYGQLLAQYNYEAEPIRLEALRDLQLAENAAKAALEKSLASAKADYDTSLADAEKVRAVQIANAEADLWITQAQANESTVRRFYAPATSPQATHEIALAVSHTEYTQSLAASYRILSQSEQNAICTEKQASVAAWLALTAGNSGDNGSQGKIDIQQVKSDAVAIAKYQRDLAQNRAIFQKTKDMLLYDRDACFMNEEMKRDGELIYQNLVIELNSAYSERERQSWVAYSVYPDMVRWNAIHLAAEKALADAKKKYNDAIARTFYNPSGWGMLHFPVDLYRNLQEHGIQSDEIGYTYRISLADAEWDYQNAVVLADKNYATDEATLECNYTQSLAKIEKTKQAALLDCDGIWQEDFLTTEYAMLDATADAWRDYQVDVAETWLAEVGTWKLTEKSLWADYQYALAEVTVQWVTKYQDDMLTYILAENDLYRTSMLDQYAAQDTWTLASIQAQFDYDSAVQNAKRDFTTALTAEEYEYQIAKNRAEWDAACQEYEDYLGYRRENARLWGEDITNYHKIYCDFWFPSNEITRCSDYHYAEHSFGTPSQNFNSDTSELYRIMYYDDAVRAAELSVNGTRNSIRSGDNPTSSAATDREEAKANAIADAALILAEQTLAIYENYFGSYRQAEVDYETALANADHTYSYAMAEQDYTLQIALAALDAQWLADELETDWQYQFATSQAEKDYETTAYLRHWTQTVADWTADPSAWNTLRKEVAAADLANVSASWLTMDAYLMAVYYADQMQLNMDKQNNQIYAQQIASQDRTLAKVLADAQKTRDIALATAVADRGNDEWKAEVKLDIDQWKCEIEYDRDVPVLDADWQRDRNEVEITYYETYWRSNVYAWEYGTYNNSYEPSHVNMVQKNAIVAQATKKRDSDWLVLDKQRIEDIGQRQIERAETLGDVGIIYAWTIFDARVSATQTINDAELAHVNTCNAAYIVWTSATFQADASYQIATANTARNHTIAVDASKISYASGGTHQRIWAEAVATAQTDYYIAEAQKKVNTLQTALPVNPTAKERYDLGWAKSQLAWFETMQDAYITLAVDSAEADFLLNYELAVTAAFENGAMWSNYLAYLASATEAQKQLAIAETAAANAYDLADVKAENAWYLETETLEYERLISLYETEKTRAVDYATAYAQYQNILALLNYSHPDYYTISSAFQSAQTDIRNANTAAIAKADAQWTSGQIAADASYKATIHQAVNAEFNAYDAADKTYSRRMNSAFDAKESADKATSDQYAAMRDLLQRDHENKAKDAFGVYTDAYFEAMTLSTVTAPLVTATSNSPWIQSMMWLWDTVNTAWEALRDVYLDNLEMLQDNYDSPTKALFGMLAENDGLLDDLASSTMQSANPFVVYQAEKLTADAEYIHETAVLRQEYEALQTGLREQYNQNRRQAVANFSQSVNEAEDDYTQTNTTAATNASQAMGIMNSINGMQNGTPETQQPSTRPQLTAKEFAHKLIDDGHSIEELEAVVGCMIELIETLQPSRNALGLRPIEREKIDALIELKEELESLMDARSLPGLLEKRQTLASQFLGMESPESKPPERVSYEDMVELIDNNMAFEFYYSESDEGRVIKNRSPLDWAANNITYSKAMVVRVVFDDGSCAALVYRQVSPRISTENYGTYKPMHYELVSVYKYQDEVPDYRHMKTLATDVWRADAWRSEALLKFVLHMIPFGAAADYALQGDITNTAISLVGDVALLAGWGVLGKTKAALRVAIGAEMMLAGGRTIQAIDNFSKGKNLEAWGNCGEVVLRVLGINAHAKKLFIAKNAVHDEIAELDKQIFRILLKEKDFTKVARELKIAGYDAKTIADLLHKKSLAQAPKAVSEAYSKLPLLRQQYVKEVEALKDVVQPLKDAGFSEEAIARAVSQMRRDIGVKYKDLTPAEFRETIYQRNLINYGDPLGPTVDFFRKQDKSWAQIIEGATRVGGKDLGF